MGSGSLDTPRASDAPTFDAPDAPPERLVLWMVDSTACPSVALPARARALHDDATPRVPWTRSLDELGMEGGFYDNGP